MKSKDWIIISLISIGTLLLTRKTSEDIPTPDVASALRQANLGIMIGDDEIRVMQYAELMRYEGQRQGIAPEIIAGVMRVESSGNPQAKAYEKTVNDWSYGLMQMLTSTANELKNLNSDLQYDTPTSLFSPAISIEIGTYYLKRKLGTYADAPKKNPITDMIASYNAGIARLNASGLYINSKGDTVVQDYVNKVMGYKSRFRLMFKYLYPSYTNQFPSSVWGG